MGDSQGISVGVKSAAETRLNTLASTMSCRPHTHSFYFRSRGSQWTVPPKSQISVVLCILTLSLLTVFFIMFFSQKILLFCIDYSVWITAGGLLRSLPSPCNLEQDVAITMASTYVHVGWRNMIHQAEHTAYGMKPTLYSLSFSL